MRYSREAVVPAIAGAAFVRVNRGTVRDTSANEKRLRFKENPGAFAPGFLFVALRST
jgi:hypothetical protein